MLERWLIDFLGWAMDWIEKIKGLFISKKERAPENQNKGEIFPD